MCHMHCLGMFIGLFPATKKTIQNYNSLVRLACLGPNRTPTTTNFPPSLLKIMHIYTQNLFSIYSKKVENKNSRVQCEAWRAVRLIWCTLKLMKCKEKAIGQRLWQDPTLSNFNLPTDTNATVPSILSITVLLL